MKDTQILSAFHEVPPPTEALPTPVVPVVAALVFDACQAGVVLRAVLFVEVCADVVVLFGAFNWMHWVVRLDLVTGGVLPATLTCLLLACMTKR